MSISTAARPAASTVTVPPLQPRPPDSLVRPFLRLGWRVVRAVLDRTAGRVFIWACSSHSRFVRTVVFDAAQRSAQQGLLLYTNGREQYVLNTRDDMICRSVFVHGEFDFTKLEEVMLLLRRRLGIERLDTIIDVGANIGTICIPAVARGYANDAIAIEPHPLNCRILRTNVALNGLHDRIKVFECACGAERAGSVQLLRPGDNWGDVRVTTESETCAAPENQRQTVGSRRVDDLVGAAPSGPTLLWIDTQGFEAAVLQGATGLIARRVPVVVEFDPAMLARRAASLEALVAVLGTYASFVDLEQPARERPVADIPRLAGEMSAAGRVFTDLLVM